MGHARDARDDDDGEDDTVDPSGARDFVMARLAAAGVSLRGAVDALEDAARLFVHPGEDDKGLGRAELLELADIYVGEAARAIQAAQELIEDIDPLEGEPDLPEDDEARDEGDEGDEDADDE